MKISYEKKLFALLAAIGATLCITIMSYLNIHSNAPWLIASFGATMVILFALPTSPLARPKNIILGHVLTTIIGLAMLKFIGVNEWSLGLAVGISILTMILTDTIHPPAGANPLIVMISNQSWDFLFMPLLAGAVLIVFIGYIYHLLISKNKYPDKWC